MGNDDTGVSLFRVIPARRGRLALMGACSLAFHAGVVLLGMAWTQPAPARLPDRPPTTLDFDPPGAPDDTVQIVEVPIAAVLPPRPGQDSLPTNVLPIPEAPPPTIEPSMDVPDTAPVRPRPTAAARVAPAATTVTHGSAAPASNTRMAGDSGVPAGGSSLGWVTPHPPYPRSTLLVRAQGATTVRVTTDASGNVVDVVIVRSTGNTVLDASTRSYVLGNWRGPANASRTTEFVYRLP